MTQQVKDLALSLLRLKSLCGTGLISGPGNFPMLWAQPKKKKKKKRKEKKKERREKESHLELRF